LGISRSGGARNPHVFQYTLRFLRSGGTRPSFARDGFFTNSQSYWTPQTSSLQPPASTLLPALRRNATSLRLQRFFHNLSPCIDFSPA
ncbi:MAG: hypothetical protein ACREYE_05425, partial [Gammaproteobacteria bacterium]